MFSNNKRFSDWVYRWYGKQASDEVILLSMYNYIGFGIDSDESTAYEDAELALLDMLSPDEKLEAGYYPDDEMDVDYALDQLDEYGYVIGNRIKDD